MKIKELKKILEPYPDNAEVTVHVHKYTRHVKITKEVRISKVDKYYTKPPKLILE